MTVFMVPDLDLGWPSLGGGVCAFIERYLVHGPGDLLGQPVVLTDEQRALIGRMYEVEPLYVVRARGQVRSKRKNPRAGKRRFERCVLSLRKGSSKTEWGAWIAIAELHHEAPVRTVSWETIGGVPHQPVGGPVTDPYIPMISYTEEQTEELAYGALRRILLESEIADDFEIGLRWVLRRHGDGKAEAVSTSPNARDGARTTFQWADETHRLTLDTQRRAWTVMLANLPKRPLADPWALETTTAPEPGGGSVAEATMDYARHVAGNGKATSRLFFFHREASSEHDLTTDAGLRAAITEASGPYVARWSDVDRIAQRFGEPDADRAYLERVWLNRPVQASAKAFDVGLWESLARPGQPVVQGTPITLGFDGSRYDDATALVATRVDTGYQWVVGLWERPATVKAWEVPVGEVDAAVHDAFARWRVVKFYADPPKWESWIAAWAGKYGDKRVLEYWTNRRKRMAEAIRAFVTAMQGGEITHDGSPDYARHIGNACRLYTTLTDDEEQPLWILRKERPDSPHKIDLAMAGILSWTARTEAIGSGEGLRTRQWLLAT